MISAIEPAVRLKTLANRSEIDYEAVGYIRHCSMLKLVTLAAVALIGATSVSAQSTSLATAKPAETAKDPDKLICERVEQIGTRLGARRVCMTAAQWAEERRVQREATEAVQRNTNQSPSN
jgi:hypothetical protein